MELSPNVVVLEHGGKTVYLIGTAHVSEKSVQEVKDTIALVKPDTVCVELCEARYAALTDENRWANMDIFRVIKEGKTLFLLANLAIGAYQRRLGKELGVRPGAELLAGAECAKTVGANLELIDRDVHITLKRTWGKLGLWKRAQLFGGIIESLFPSEADPSAHDIEKLKEKAHLSEMMAEFAKALPEVKGPLIDERDQFMMSSITDSPGKVIVAVVGAAHVPGMLEQLGKPIDRNALKELPPKSKAWGWLKWVIPAIILAAFYVGISKNEGQTFAELLNAWVLPNTVFAALLTALAGGKLLSVVTAGIASPITSLNPLINCGMFVGLVEAWLRKPTVADCQRIADDVQTVRGFFRNPFTRVLVVAMASTIGSAMGAWVGLSWVLTLVAG
ncbi:MAG: TraB/GumN family protein [Myxococcales bacterium]|nr:TraB/GumN family protein [Myxococcales bacterium]